MKPYKLLGICLAIWLVWIVILFFLGDPSAWNRESWVGLLLMCSIYGVLRAATFHPRYRAEYLRWLKTTTWSCKHPLPFGPIEPGWGDTTFVIPISIGWTMGGPIAPLLGGTIICYTITLSLTLGQANPQAARVIYNTPFDNTRSA